MGACGGSDYSRCSVEVEAEVEKISCGDVCELSHIQGTKAPLTSFSLRVKNHNARFFRRSLGEPYPDELGK